MKWWWSLCLIPALLGGAISVVLNLGMQNVPILVLRVDVGTVASILGIILSLMIFLTIFVFHQVQRVQDVSALQATEKHRRFLQQLDHEFKNPLTAILAGLTNISTAIMEDTHRDSLLSVEAQVKRLRDLVADLRKLSDLETREIEWVLVDISVLLKGLLVLTEEEGTKDRRVILSIPEAPWPLPKVDGDWDLLFLAVHNLLHNALKFTSPGDTIEIRAFEDGSEVIIEVADTGPGIPEDEVPNVWEELYRGKSARGKEGSGLGLALVRSIVTRHGGQVDLRSRSGQGTVFVIRLPTGDGRKR
jgi:two-component system OmpR family sensor kinase